ncbi:MAG: hypothetical protein Fues2KO_01610 [Fuerstiella sp.]
MEVMQSNPIRQRVWIRLPHLVACALVALVVSWGLLSQNPFAAVKRSPLSILSTISDLVMHFTAYGTLSAIAFGFVANSDVRVRRCVLMLLMVHALGTECLQVWIPNRTCDALDALANLGGIGAGMTVVWALSSRLQTARVPG